MLDQLLNAIILYPLIAIFFLIASLVGVWLGKRRQSTVHSKDTEPVTVTSILALLALLLAFTLSHALSRYEDRRSLVLEEAKAIDSVSHLVLLLPKEVQAPTLNLLYQYAITRAGLGVPYNPLKLENDIERSKYILRQLWENTSSFVVPQSLPISLYLVALDDLTKLQQKRLGSYLYHIPDAVILMLLSVAALAIGFTGYHVSLTETKPQIGTMIMAITVAVVIAGVIDLDQPARGLIKVPTKALLDTVEEIQFWKGL